MRHLVLLGMFLALPAYGQNMKSVPVNDGVGTVLAPSLFGGGPGLCFPAETAPKAVRAILLLPVAEKAEKEIAALRAALAAKDLQIDALRLSVAKLEMAASSFDLALNKQKESATELRKELSVTKWRWLWTSLGSVATGFGLGYGLKTLIGR